MNSQSTLEMVKTYYGKVLGTSTDLKTSACCSAESLPKALANINEMLHNEVREKFYGCGLVIPPLLEGCTVLDLGCGSGRDAYILSKLVGPNGKVIGIDMTSEQLAVARRHQEYHAKAFGYKTSNVEFIHGYIEDLAGAGIEPHSIDVVVSNCVINLSPEKPRVMAEVLRALKKGGEMYFSDVYVDRRLPVSFHSDPVLLGECLGGALYTEDFRRILEKLEIRDFRKISQTPIALEDPEIHRKVGMARFSSITHRIFNMDLEDRCEDYGQVATYLGSISGCPHGFMLDDHHFFETGRPMTVCRNTAAMLAKSRFGNHFKVVGDSSTHFGLFPCGPTPMGQTSGGQAEACAPGGACC